MAGYQHDRFALHAVTAARAIVPLVNDWLHPASVLDLGCGLGLWLAEWEKVGAQIMGVDGEYLDRSQLLVSGACFQSADLEQPVDVKRRFDLVMSLEVAEHISEASADTLIHSVTRHSDVVLFSAAIPRQGGDFHVNCQWPSYWAARFEQHGYRPYDIIRPRIWDDENLVWWYRQNVMLYARGSACAKLDAVPHAQFPLDLVHPRWYLDMTAEQPLRAEAKRFANAVGVWMRGRAARFRPRVCR